MNNPFNFGKHRLDSVFIEKNYCSTRSAKNFFLKNQIFVNEKKITDRKILVSFEDKIEFFDKISQQNEKIKIEKDIYILIDKPKGIVCSTVSDSHKTVFEWLNETSNSFYSLEKQKRLHCVGRLDCETSGLLILTTDGFFSNFITNPKNNIKKEYEVLLKNVVDSENQKNYIEKAKYGILLPAEKKVNEEFSNPSKIEWISQKKCRITVTEGKFHEVRRIFRALNNEVLELKRISIENLQLSQIQVSQSNFITLESPLLLFKDFPVFGTNLF